MDRTLPTFRAKEIIIFTIQAVLPTFGALPGFIGAAPPLLINSGPSLIKTEIVAQTHVSIAAACACSVAD